MLPEVLPRTPAGAGGASQASDARLIPATGSPPRRRPLRRERERGLSCGLPTPERGLKLVDAKCVLRTAEHEAQTINPRLAGTGIHRDEAASSVACQRLERALHAGANTVATCQLQRRMQRAGKRIESRQVAAHEFDAGRGAIRRGQVQAQRAGQAAAVEIPCRFGTAKRPSVS